MQQQETSAVALRAMGYGGQTLERGELFTFQGLATDTTLRTHNYAGSFSGDPVTCGVCGRQFATKQWRQMHGAAAHLDAYQGKPPWILERDLADCRARLTELVRHEDIRRQQVTQAEAAEAKFGVIITPQEREKFVEAKRRANELRAHVDVDADQIKKLRAEVRRIEAELNEARANDPVAAPWEGE